MVFTSSHYSGQDTIDNSDLVLDYPATAAASSSKRTAAASSSKRTVAARDTRDPVDADDDDSNADANPDDADADANQDDAEESKPSIDDKRIRDHVRSCASGRMLRQALRFCGYTFSLRAADLTVTI